MDKRILAVLVAAIAGAGVTAAQAEPAYLQTNSGNAVSNGFGGCWQTGAGGGSVAACPPGAAASGASSANVAAPREQLAQASSPGAYRRSAAAAGASAAPPSPAAQSEGYVITGGSRNVVVDGAGQCVRSGAWTPAMAAEPCAAVPRASTPLPVVAAAPEPPPAPVAKAAPETPAPAPTVIERVNLSTDVLFGFDNAHLRPEGREKLDELVQKAQNAEVDRIVIAGYADRIGAEQYNQKLSQQRAQAVADYLASKGVARERLVAEGRGESNPVTGNECRNTKGFKNLVACLQPDRRVEAELLGSREVAAGSATGATGTTGAGSSSGTGQGSSGSTQ